MSPFLLDVNLLIALHSPFHKNFQQVHQWFEEFAIDRFASCAITQSGFIRVSAQLSENAPDAELPESRFALSLLTARPGHFFWPMELPYLDATAPFQARVHGHRQISDAYLLGLALHHGGKLATLDRAILHIAGPEFKDSVELISPSIQR